MRMLKKVGAPRDRRIDRRKVAMAAIAALLLTVTSVQAQIIDFTIDSSQSWLGISGSGFVGTDALGNFNTPFLATTAQNGGLVNGAPIPNGSLNAAIRGDIFASVVPGAAIQFFASGVQQIDTKVTGFYKNGRDGAGNLIPGASTAPGNLGGKNAAVAAFINAHDLQYGSPGSYLDPFTPAAPTPLPTDALGFFSATGVSLPQTYGWQDITSGIASPAKIDLSGSNYPVNFSETFASGNTTPIDAFVPLTGNIDPVTFHLVLPVNFTLWSRVTSSGNLIGYLVSTLNGQIVANPAPEPSSVVLFGFGVVGLLSYAWRVRKRKLLVA